MRILFLGDVFGSCGKRILAEHLPEILSEHAIEVCIANAENVAGGKGITLNILKKFHKYGVDIVTGGNHSMSRPEVFTETPPQKHVLRPLNLRHEERGEGSTVFTLSDGRKIGVINLCGRTYFNEDLECPFTVAKAIAQHMAVETAHIIVDFHAEATSEKVCLANYLDGRVSAVLGTHTHVQTADERILPKGTAYISDVGMTGPEDSAIGMKLKQVIDRFVNQAHVRFQPASAGPMLNGVILEIDESTGKATAIQRLYQRYRFKS